MDNLVLENDRLKSKEAELRSEVETLGKRVVDAENASATAEDAGQETAKSLAALKETSEATIDDLRRRIESHSKVSRKQAKTHSLPPTLSHTISLSINLSLNHFLF